MKLSELRPCDCCGEKIAPQFYVVRSSLAIFSPNAARATLGLNTMFGGALALAEAMSPDPEVVKLAGDHDKRLWSEFFLCSKCHMGDVNLALLNDKRSDATEEQSAAADGSHAEGKP